MDVKTIKEKALILIPITATLLSVFYLSTKSTEKKGLKEIPYPPHVINWPIFGHLFSLGNSPSKQVGQWHKELGPIFKIKMGNQLWVIIGDPFLAHEIFVKKGSSTSSRPYHRFNVKIYGKNSRGISFIHYDDKWKKKRKAAMSILDPSSVDKFSDLLEAETDHLMNRFTQISQSGESVDPFQELQLTSMNVIVSVCLAIRFESTKDPTFKAIHEFQDKALMYGGAASDVGSFLPSLGWIDFFTGIEKKLYKFVHENRDILYEELITDALKRKEHSLIKDLYQMKDEGLIDKDDILVFLSDLIGAGTDTIAISLYWTFAILSQYPHVQTKLIKELDTWKAKHPPHLVPNFNQHRDDFPYSICVQKEVMRFRPGTSFGLSHYSTEDILVDGYFIPKGSVLLSHMPTLHMSQNFYKDPQLFRPERFFKNTKKMRVAANAKIGERDHFNFGWGRRICPGIHLAENQVFNFYVRFFSKFTIEPGLDIQGNPVKIDLNHYDKEGITSKPAPCTFRIVPRRV
ncbi:hypothetical protein G6F56_002394 [Rhizopus delemar]|nr:hypothetical protein G6F56_002394 [Rhizopus delemar]